MPQRMRMQQQRAIFIVLVVASCYVVPAFAAEALLKRRTATPQLPEDHFLLRRNPDAGAHTPEQVNSKILSVVMCALDNELRR